MKVAIIGAGFAGLASAYFLLEAPNIEISIFEEKKVGGGASGVASGLLHPYPGLAARRSYKAEEALTITKQLLRVAEAHTPSIVAAQSGILRQSLNREEQQRLVEHCLECGDIEQIEENLFLIHSGITVLSENYLEGLSNAVKKKGAEFIFQKVDSLDELKRFDQIIIAAGYGVRHFPECRHLKVKFLKGQALRLEGKPPLEKSFISKGYLAHLGSQTHFELGSTYEREFLKETPDLETAKQLLQDKLSLCPHAKIMDCKAAVRVCSVGHYLPIVEKVAPNAHVFTGLGSRGLLYHGFFARQLVQAIVSNNKVLL